jgi:hypothetical protein
MHTSSVESEMEMRSAEREAGVNALVKYMEDRRLANDEIDQVHQYNANSYHDHVAGVSSGVITVLICKRLVSPQLFRLVTPPLAGIALFAAYRAISDYRTDNLLYYLARTDSNTSLARRLRKALVI